MEVTWQEEPDMKSGEASVNIHRQQVFPSTLNGHKRISVNVFSVGIRLPHCPCFHSTYCAVVSMLLHIKYIYLPIPTILQHISETAQNWRSLKKKFLNEFYGDEVISCTRWKKVLKNDKEKKNSTPDSTTLNPTGRALPREVKREGAGMTRPRLPPEGAREWVGSL